MEEEQGRRSPGLGLLKEKVFTMIRVRTRSSLAVSRGLDRWKSRQEEKGERKGPKRRKAHKQPKKKKKKRKRGKKKKRVRTQKLKKRLAIKYPKEWNNALREKIRDRAGRKCEWCGKTEADNGRKLTVHHKDKNPTNCEEDNLEALCTGCHDLKAHSGKYRKYATVPKDVWDDMVLERDTAKLMGDPCAFLRR